MNESNKCCWCNKDTGRTPEERMRIVPSGKAFYCDKCWLLRVADMKAYVANLIKNGIILKKSLDEAVKIVRDGNY